ncbi:MAG: Ig-like domain-containing protein, partial [bacterium]|nr:Ig-like domain-containing protein [bacterium]
SASMSCRILRGGVYGVAEDRNPPRLVISGRSGKITFQLTDGESGIDDSSVRCSVDGRAAVAEYEYEEDGGDVWTPIALKAGDHNVTFTAADRAGNERSWTITVTVK